jgi:glycosyltransferase involved in cell wall biosynthesis
MKLVAMVQTYNEEKNGNLLRCLKSLANYCDDLVVYDDGSTDDSFGIYSKFTTHVIRSTKNDFRNELAHKQELIEYCKKLGADWIWRIDADEVIEPRGESEIRKLISDTEKTGWAFHMVNLWRSPAFYRVDNGYNDVVFNRLWRVHPSLHFNVQTGLHLTNYPVGATDKEGFADLQIIHYGFASDEAILAKYRMYKEHGQQGSALSRLVNEQGLMVRRSKPEWFTDINVLEINAPHVFKEPIIRKVS